MAAVAAQVNGRLTRRPINVFLAKILASLRVIGLDHLIADLVSAIDLIFCLPLMISDERQLLSGSQAQGQSLESQSASARALKQHSTSSQLQQHKEHAEHVSGEFQLSGSLAEKREQAKEFIALMHSNNFTLSELVHEGLDMELLQNLYQELGISASMAGTNSPNMPAALHNATPPSMHGETSVSGSPIATGAKNMPTQIATSTSANTQTLKPRSPNSPIFPREAITRHTPVTTSRPTSSGIAIAAPTQSNASSQPRAIASKLAKPPQPIEPALERKDYIARLLAAKSKKSAPQSGSAEADASLSLEKSKPVPLTQPAPMVSPTILDKRFSVTASLPGRETSNDMKSQSELALQKMGALETARQHKVVDPPTKLPRVEAVDMGPQSVITIADSNIADEGRSTTAPPPESSVTANVPRARQSIDDMAVILPESSSTPSDEMSVTGSAESKEPSISAIPGLFMTGSRFEVQSDASQPRVRTSQGVQEPKSKKRPVAADFDDIEPQPRANSFKRPFGQSRYDPVDELMIIEASDDESDEDHMDVSEPCDAPEPDLAHNESVPQESTQKNGLRDFPPLSDFARRPSLGRKLSSLPASAINTPPAVTTPGTSSTTDPIRKAEEEIVAMKRKIAELERKRRTKAQASRAQSPSTPKSAPKQGKATILGASESDRNEESVLQEDAEPNLTVVVENDLSLVSQDTTCTPDVAQNQDLARPSPEEWRRLRRAEIQSGLPELEANVAITAARLSALKKEMEQLESENQKRLQDKEKLVQELRALGIATEGVSPRRATSQAR